MSFKLLAGKLKLVAAFGAILLLLSSGLKAAEEPYVNSIRGTAVAQGASFDVTDEKFLNLSAWNTIRSAPYSLTPDNIVELKLNYDTSMFFYNQPFTATVNVNILCYNNPYDTSQVFQQYNNVNLSIKYDTAKGSPYKGVYYMQFSGAYKFRVVVNSISCPELGTNMPKVLMIEGRTVIKRKYNFTGGTGITKIEEPNGQVKLSWIPANYPGAEMFDLEYTVVDDSSDAGAVVRSAVASNTPLSTAFLDVLFRNNASRIVTTGSSYLFNPLYQGGYLLFRIRGVQFGNEYRTDVSIEEQNLRSEGPWSYSAQKLAQPSYALNVVQLQWHEPNLNWQYSIAFAEEGKRKETIGYFDGIFRNRQNVSLNNTDNKSIVQENFFDALGHNAVNTLPAPVNDSSIHYFQNFNRNAAGKGYSYKDMPFGANCRISPDPMSNTGGAAKYYSANNDINDYFFKKYIPDAEGYPFAVVQFTPDNTGRIFSQGSVGKELQPGTNRDTKFFYGKPTQEELDRLFGSEAGNASHFLKNMTVDPNNSITVNYINSVGKIVATALAGLTPQNLESLNSNNGVGVDVVKNLLQPQDFTKDYGANLMLGTSTFLAPMSGSYKFKYKLTPLRLEVLHGINNQLKICNTCYYDLKIYLRNNCNTALDSSKKLVTGSTIFQTNCNDPIADIIDSFTVNILNVGEYNVSYELQVSEAAWKFYDSVHLAQNTNIRPFNSFFIDQLKLSDFKGCYNECKTCYQDLGSRTDFINNKVKPLFLAADSMVYAPEFDVWANALYDSLYAHCASIQSGCGAEDPCDEEKELLLEDVKPGGQYAGYDSLYNLTEYSINVLAHRSEVWYMNEDGSYAQIEYNGQMLYANDASIPLQVFIDNFQPNWANALLPYHPEYCFYQWCTYNSGSKSFDNQVNGIESDSLATALGYFGSVTSLFNNDPFFQSGGYGYQYYNQMLDSLNLFSRTMPGYQGPDLNILQYINYELYCEENNISPGSCPTATTCRSPYMEWQLYRAYYMNLKAYFFEKARTVHPSFANCKNCFIGTDYTDIFTCNPPPATDFSVTVDNSYTGSGKRIIVKYKNAESATANRLKLTFYYSDNGLLTTFQKTFRKARGSEQYVVPVSLNNYYVVQYVECDNATSGGGGTKAIQGNTTQQSMGNAQQGKSTLQSSTVPQGETTAQQGIAIAKQQIVNVHVVDNNMAIIPNNCPCPTWDMFSVSTTGWQCWDGTDEIMVTYSGPEIPACRTVYVDIYWQDYYTGNSGWTTVSFGQGQSYAYGCIGGGVVYYKTAPTSPNKELAEQNKKLAPSATKDKNGRKPVKANTRSVMMKQGQTPEQMREAGNVPCCGGGYHYYYFTVQNVYCYDDACFVCPGSNTEPVTLCKDDPRYEQYKNKVRRYVGYQSPYGVQQDILNNYTNMQSQENTDLADNCQANCEAQADIWINALRKCTQNQTVLDTLRAKLIAVCQSGCSSDHPYGSSSNPAGTQTFQSVIAQYIPGYSVNDSCTADLISDPYPYDKQPQYEGRDVLRLETCTGARLSQLKSQYLSSGYSGSFHQWLQLQLKDDYKLTAQELTDLETAINNGCKYLKKPLSLPAALNCSNMPACVNATTILQTYAAFLAKYPGITNTNANYEILLTNYFNHALAFSLSYEDYNDYIIKAQGGTAGYELLCNRALTNQLIVASDVNSCMADVFNLALAQAVNEYSIYIDSVRQAFRMAYMAKCMNALPGLTMSTKLLEYQYTLYYYDQGNNLVKTIPPAGVQLLNDAQVAQVQTNRFNTNNACANNAPEFAFSSSLVNMPRETSYDNPVSGKYTLEAWVKLNNFGNQGILSYNAVTSSPNEAGYHLAVSGGSLLFSAGTTPKLDVQTPLLSNFLTAGSWFHIAITVDNNAVKPVKMFINGNNVPLTYMNANSPYFYVPSWAGNTLNLGGAFANGATTYLNGSIKQFRWYHRLLAQTEIVQNAYNNCLLPTSTAGMVCHVPLNEGQGSAVEDKMTYNSGSFQPSWAGLSWTNYVAGVYPNHKLPSNFEYNSDNTLLRKTTPDGGATRYWYDVLGRVVASQTAEQKLPKNPANSAAGRYSYTKYDTLGRIIESGEKYNATSLMFLDEGGVYDSRTPSQLSAWYTLGNDRQVTITIYDKPNTAIVTNTTITNQQSANTRKRVVSSVYKEFATNSYYDYATHYIYDINGNVKTVYQDLKPMRDVEMFTIGGGSLRGIRRLDYDYDLVSGKTNRVTYQKGLGDQFIYKYEYDADNRLTAAYSSRNGLQWQKDARYYYYLHGPIARIELGRLNVQGVDYAYTLQGWLKGINGQLLDVNNDMAGDGLSTSPAFQKFGRDVYAMSLGYFNNDYKAIGGVTANAFNLSFTAPPAPAGATGNTGHSLYNGSISNSTIAFNLINNSSTKGYSYLYDQLNRLTGMKQHNLSGTSWNYSSFNQEYSERISYDANGNINTYLRTGANVAGMPLAMDNMKYLYYYTATDNTRKEYDVTAPLPADVKLLTNQLAHIDDSEAAGNYATDIDDQDPGNYDYDNAGNLIKSVKDSITSMDWNAQGKVKQVVKSSGITINYGYDGSGFKVVKQVMNGGVQQSREFYILDANGRTIAVYKDQFDYIDWSEQHLYGAKRIGIWKYGKASPGLPLSPSYDSLMVGSYQYELTNHLENVMAVISDKKTGFSSNNLTNDYYTAEVLSESDNYPGGMVMPGRSINSLMYRYSINGQTKEKELNENITSAEFWMYDSRTMRRWNVDPVSKPHESPYAAFSNNPIYNVDPNGDSDTTYTQPGGGTIKVPGDATNVTISSGNEQASGMRYFGVSKKELARIRITDEMLKQMTPAGTLISFTLDGNTYNAQFTFENNAWSFEGYYNSAGKPYIYDEERGTVGKPGFGESLIPVWGSGREAVYNFQKGNIWSGLGYSALAISDIFLVKSLFQGAAKGGFKAFTLGNREWGGFNGYRKFYVESGFAKPGEPLHHWLIHQNGSFGKYVPNVIKNQMWNLKPFTTQAEHMIFGHGKNYLGQPGANLMNQLWHGTPTWPKLFTLSYGGRGVGFTFGSK